MARGTHFAPAGQSRMVPSATSGKGNPAFFIISTVNAINASTDSHLHSSSPGVSFSTILRGYAPPPSFTHADVRNKAQTSAIIKTFD
ncbi:hypothetical protein CABS01_11733 [Colletotrichum abscissum]|uniref:Uncharacterized protein n=1 Tax=Colletotrichum abscissum TaxID=1671311 RepID=A0A9P9XCN5_9PEZI|nr:uncharacterized protein CABS01_11733 [Colletotrichum abscissum]KAI3548684.1 hypothetical protein CABS02_08214 [Colletotrichum abscissum]KAK1492836.1 hypothetical protein CABS01_11733 [Colletotrichum abscissum]